MSLISSIAGPTSLYPHTVPFSQCRTIAIFKIVRRKILLDLREANAYIWGRPLPFESVELLRACAKKMLEELGEVAEHTGHPPAFSRFASLNREALVEELADVAEVLKLVKHGFDCHLGKLGANLTAGPWHQVVAGWQQLAALPPSTSLSLLQLMHLCSITRMEMALIGNLLSPAVSWEAIEAARLRKQREKGPLVPFLLYGTTLASNNPWCDVLAAKHTEVDVYTFDPDDAYTHQFDHL